MPRDVRGEIPIVWADTGDVADPIVVAFDKGYEISFEQTGGKKPTREGTNKIYQQLYSMGRDVSQFGAALPYSQTINFLVDAIVTHNGKMYICTQANGPGSSVRIPGAGGSGPFWNDQIQVIPPQFTEINFTPVLSDEAIGGNVATTTNASGRSLQIGNLVTVVIRMEGINTAGMTGANIIRLQNLPVAINASFGASAAVHTAFVNFSNYVTTDTSGSSMSVLSFIDITPGAQHGLIHVDDIISTNADLIFSVNYIAA